MTGEELAEEFLHCNDRICNAGYMKKVKCKACTRKQDYLAGLTEGRKEKCFEQNSDGTIRPCEVMKENAELKEQIEKMKCCYNCKYGRIYFTNEIIVDCLANKVNPNNKYKNCDKWELAE